MNTSLSTYNADLIAVVQFENMRQPIRTPNYKLINPETSPILFKPIPRQFSVVRI